MVRARIGYFRLGRQREPSERSGLQVERSRHPRREEAAGGPGPGRGRAAPLPGALRTCTAPGRQLLFLQTSGPALSGLPDLAQLNVPPLPASVSPRP